MAFGDSYTSGTVSTDDDSSPVNTTLIIGTGTVWTESVYPGDLFWSSGVSAPIAEVVDDTHILLRNDWPGSLLVDADYSIEFLSGLRHEPTEFSAQLIDVKNRLRIFDSASPVFSIVEFGLNAPPSATVGDRYVVGTSPSGAWSGHNNQIAEKTETGWLYLTPTHGWAVIDEVDNFVRTWTGTEWTVGAGLGATITFAGEWDSGTDYIPGNVVAHDDRTWVAVDASTNSEPSPSSDDWVLFLNVGEDGGAITLRYQFLTDTANSDPGAGSLKMNGAPAGATILRVSKTDAFGSDWSTLLTQLGTASTSAVKGYARIATKGDGTRQWIAAVTAVTAVGGTYFNLAVSGPIASLAALQNAADVLLLFTPKGDKGDTGSQGNIGLTGTPGGAFAIPYTVDANSTTDSDPGLGVVRFNATPQVNATVLRVDLQSSAGATVAALLGQLASGTSAVKATARLFLDSAPRTSWLEFNVLSVATLEGYRNVTIQVTASSADSPFAHGAAVVLDWGRAGDKGDAGTIAINSVTTGEAGSSASVVNVGTASAAQLNFAIPRGDQGDSFVPTHVVPLLEDRSTYDQGPAVDDDGNRLSVLVESDASNDDLPTLYFLLIADDSSPSSAVWSEGFTFQSGNEADLISFDNVASGLAGTTVQDAIDEVAEQVDDIPDPVAMAFIFGG